MLEEFPWAAFRLTFVRDVQSGGCERLKRGYCFWISEKYEGFFEGVKVWREAAGLDLFPGPQKSNQFFLKRVYQAACLTVLKRESEGPAAVLWSWEGFFNFF